MLRASKEERERRKKNKELRLSLVYFQILYDLTHT